MLVSRDWKNLRTKKCHELQYEGPAIKKGPGVDKPPPGGPRGAPRKTGGATGILKRSLARSARTFFGPNSCILVFLRILRFSHREPRNLGEGEGPGVTGVNKLRSKIGSNSLGEGGFY
jgi:hypothetical protein